MGEFERQFAVIAVTIVERLSPLTAHTAQHRQGDAVPRAQAANGSQDSQPAGAAGAQHLGRSRSQDSGVQAPVTSWLLLQDCRCSPSFSWPLPAFSKRSGAIPHSTFLHLLSQPSTIDATSL